MSKPNKLLIPGRALQVLPDLAIEFGLNEAIIIQQIWFWCLDSRKRFDGKPWVYNSKKRWLEFFPFWSIDVIRRALRSAEDQRAILSIPNPDNKWDKTKWYTVNLEHPLFSGLSYPDQALPRPSSEDSDEQPTDSDITDQANAQIEHADSHVRTDADACSKEVKLHDEYINKISKQDSKQVKDVSPYGDTCSELQNSPEPEAIITIPLVGKQGEYAITQARIDEWQEAYPAVDVPQELRNCRQWNIANPRKRKTRRGVLAHITGWLARKQDQGPRGDWQAKENPVGATHTGPGLNTKNTRNTRSIFDHDYASKDYQSGATRDEDLPQWARDALAE